MSETNYIGTQFAKPLQEDTLPNPERMGEMMENPAPNTYKKYATVAQWCNESGLATIEDKGDYFEVVAIPEPTEEELAAQELEQAKAERAEAVSQLTVTVDGMTFDADETSQNRMSRVVSGAQALGVDLSTTTQIWVLADNSVATPTVAQLAQALKLAGEAQTALWTKPYETDESEGE